MDVKFPLNNYLRHLDATSDVERDRVPQGVPQGRAPAAARRSRAAPTSTRPAAPSTACCCSSRTSRCTRSSRSRTASILDDALRDKVVFCSPLTLFAVLAVIRQAVDNFQLSRTSHEILELLQGFEKQWDRFVEQMDKVGRNLKTAANAFEELEGTRRRGVERELEKIDALRRDQVRGAPTACCRSRWRPDFGLRSTVAGS